MRESIAVHYADDMSKDELDALKLDYERKGWTKVRVTRRQELPSSFLVTGVRPEPSESIDFVNVTSLDPDKSELVEALEDAGIHGATVDYWTEPYRFEDAYQISTLYYRR